MTSSPERQSRDAGFGRLDHVFLIIMENQTDTDILGNPNAPFINAYARVANQATARSTADCNGQITLTGAPVAHNCALYDYPVWSGMKTMLRMCPTG